MTEQAMRQRLAEAMGWTDLQDVSPCGRMQGLWGTEPAGWFCSGSAAREGIIAPDPLESDRDAALLRAWCVGRHWDVQSYADYAHAECSTGVGDGPRAEVDHTEEPDPCRRERLALCQAVLQALEVQP